MVPALLGVHFTAVVIELFFCFVAKVFGTTMSEDMVVLLFLSSTCWGYAGVG